MGKPVTYDRIEALLGWFEHRRDGLRRRDLMTLIKGLTFQGYTPEELTELLSAEYARWHKAGGEESEPEMSFEFERGRDEYRIAYANNRRAYRKENFPVLSKEVQEAIRASAISRLKLAALDLALLDAIHETVCTCTRTEWEHCQRTDDPLHLKVLAEGTEICRREHHRVVRPKV